MATPWNSERIAAETGLTVPLVEARQAKGLKWCPGCRRWRRLSEDPKKSEWSKNRQFRDGLAHRCKDCCNAKGREYYRGVVTQVDSGLPAALRAGMPPELFPPPAAGEGIGCLRCRHAAVYISTDFAGLQPGGSTTIFCHKQEAAVPIVWSHCPLADPRPAKPHALSKWWKRFGSFGDRLHHAGPLMVEFLKHCWSAWPAVELVKVCGWTMFKISQVVRYHGVGGVRTDNNRLHHMEPTKGRRCFTPEQSAWILAEYRSDRWPRPARYHGAPAGRKAWFTRRRNRIVEQVHALNPDGPRWTWQQIQRHIQKMQQTAWKRARRHGVRKVNQHLAIEEKKGGGKTV
jgi:hypothetical protein